MCTKPKSGIGSHLSTRLEREFVERHKNKIHGALKILINLSKLGAILAGYFYIYS